MNDHIDTPQLILFGGGVNTYSMARAFFDKYHKRSLVVTTGGPSRTTLNNSRIHAEMCLPIGLSRSGLVKTVVQQAVMNLPERRIILIGCEDKWIEAIAAVRNQLPHHVTAPYPPIDLVRALTNPASFAALAHQFGLDIPKTWKTTAPLRAPQGMEGKYVARLGAGPFPMREFVLKDTKMTVIAPYAPDDPTSGPILPKAPAKFVIQQFVEGDCDHKFVCMTYSDRGGHTVASCLAQVLLEETDHEGITRGPVAALTCTNNALQTRIALFLDSVGYTGPACFDIKYDSKSGQYMVLSMSCHLGRANYAMTASGQNIVDLIVRDRLLQEKITYTDSDEKIFWTLIPRRLTRKYVTNPDYVASIRFSEAIGNAVNPLVNIDDRSVLRRIAVHRVIRQRAISIQHSHRRPETTRLVTVIPSQ